MNLVDWLRQNSQEKDETFIRGFLGRMLFSGEETQKSSNVLSGGEKVRCLLSKVMLEEGNLLVLDEPTSALDPVMSREVGDLIQTLHHDQITMVLVTHDLTLAEHIAPEVSFLDQGKIMAADSIANLSAEHQPVAIRSFFSARS
jgi:ATPase subunit of ABC transporter with duplicated ATPase domains